jgi:hypothetical protein
VKHAFVEPANLSFLNLQEEAGLTQTQMDIVAKWHNTHMIQPVRECFRKLRRHVDKNTKTGSEPYRHSFSVNVPEGVKCPVRKVTVEYTDILWLAAELYSDTKLGDVRLDKPEVVRNYEGLEEFDELNTGRWWRRAVTEAPEVRGSDFRSGFTDIPMIFVRLSLGRVLTFAR